MGKTSELDEIFIQLLGCYHIMIIPMGFKAENSGVWGEPPSPIKSLLEDLGFITVLVMKKTTITSSATNLCSTHARGL